MKLFLFFSAAEASGDQHSAELVRAVRERRPEIRCAGFGGSKMRAAGCELYEDFTAKSTMGTGFVRYLGFYVGLMRRFDRMLKDEKPSAVVLVDSPGLNFFFARLAKWRGVRVIYYICPQIWAWAPWRRRKVLRYTDLLMAILPFEKALYAGGGVPVEYVGHPLADELETYQDSVRPETRSELGVGDDQKLIALLPGSRRQEVEGLIDVFMRTVVAMDVPREKTCIVVSCYRPAFEARIRSAAEAAGLDIIVFSQDARRLMASADFAIVASGTASLEVGYFGVPMVVLYGTSVRGIVLYRLFCATPWFALPNILGAPLAAEFGGENMVYENMFRADPVEEVAPIARALFLEGDERHRAKEKLRRLREHAFATGGVARAAETLLEFLDG